MEFEDKDREEEEEEDDDNDNDNDNEDDHDDQTMRLISPSFKKTTSLSYRYRECLKNHAVSIGGHAVDGCGEFMPAGPPGSLDSLKCAACNCHRNFHRKELLPTVTAAPNHHHHHHLSVFSPRPPPHLQPPPHVFQFYPYNPTAATPPSSRPLALPSPTAVAAEDQVTGGMMTMTMTMTSSSGKKRHRTKFTQEQKDRMLELAERLGWRLQKQDETVVQQFCDETGVKRHVLKVWMHNNKHTLGKKLIPDNV
ncbi:hypothetical protein vseg_005039 [Gypsophila vaccaria]